MGALHNNAYRSCSNLLCTTKPLRVKPWNALRRALWEETKQLLLLPPLPHPDLHPAAMSTDSSWSCCCKNTELCLIVCYPPSRSCALIIALWGQRVRKNTAEQWLKAGRGPLAFLLQQKHYCCFVCPPGLTQMDSSIMCLGEVWGDCMMILFIIVKLYKLIKASWD